jgi:hypothetical protein
MQLLLLRNNPHSLKPEKEKLMKVSTLQDKSLVVCVDQYFHKVQDLLRSSRFAFPDFYKIRYLNWRRKNFNSCQM